MDIMKDNFIIIKIDDPEEKEEIVSEVLLDLPEWFGLPESTKGYIEGSKQLPFWVARNTKETIGFITLRQSSMETGELYCMGIKKECHRMGVGKQLYIALEQYAKSRYKYLLTLSGDLVLAEELTTEVFYRVLEKRKEFRGESKVPS